MPKTHAGDVPPGEHLVIGLNPPYGMRNALAHKFMYHAARFRPRLIVLIVPPTTEVGFVAASFAL